VTRALALALAVGALGAGCVSRAAPPSLYILTGAAPAAAAGRAASARPGPAVGIQPVVLAAYLDRLAMVTRGPAGELRLAPEHMWGEGLKDGVARVLADNLAAMIPTDRVVVFPWRSTWAVQYRVGLEISRFDGPLGDGIALEGRWRLLDEQGKELALRTVALRETPADASYGAMAAAQSRLLTAVSRDIAGEIAARSR
jgi:hypothetical protein